MLQSMLSFLAILRGMMGFPEYGHFVLMLMQMLQHDIRKVASHARHRFVCTCVSRSVLAR